MLVKILYNNFQMRKLYILLIFSALGLSTYAQYTPSLWTMYAQQPNNQTNIPNCSYAGYKYGDVGIPTSYTTVINVKDAPYNATGDGVTDDSDALIAALTVAETAGGGVVYLPDGTYQSSKVIFIHGNNVILKGQSVSGTKIRFTKSLSTAYAENYTLTTTNSLDQSMWSWCGGMIWITPKTKNTYLTTSPTQNINTSWVGSALDKIYLSEKETWNVTNELTSISSNENRGSFSFTVANSANLSPNQYISIRYKNTSDWSLMKYFAGDGSYAEFYPWGTGTAWISAENRPYIDWVAQIESVSGNTIFLKQPLRIPLRAEWECKLMNIGDVIKGSGITNLNIELEKDYVSDYANSSWRTANHNREKGWNGIYLNNAIDCFVKDVTIYDAETSAGVAACKNVTFTGVRIKGKDQTKSVHHGFCCRVQSQDILFENFELNNYGQFDHGMNIEDFSMGTAWHSGLVINGCFDTHKLLPAECIRTNIKVQVLGGYGGHSEAGPQIGTRFVHWGVEVKGTNNTTIVPSTTMPKGALVGIINTFASPGTVSECVTEGIGQQIEPLNLYLAQKKLRNNIVQSESEKLPWPILSVPGRVEAESSVFKNVAIDIDAPDAMDATSTIYLNSFMNSTKKAEYDVEMPQNGLYTLSFRLSSSESANNLAVLNLRGDTLVTVPFIGIGRSFWKTYDAPIYFNKGRQTLVLGWKQGAPCINWFEVKAPTTIYEIAAPDIVTKPGKYNSQVKVILSTKADNTIRFTTNHTEPNQNSELYINDNGIVLNETTTLKIKAFNSVNSSSTLTATYDLIPAPIIPCTLTGMQYSDAFGVVPSGQQASYNDPGTWSEYIVNAPSAGSYILYENVSIKTRAPVYAIGFDVQVNGILAQRFENLPDMGGNWDRFGHYPIRVNLNQGLNTIRHTATTTRCNLNAVELIQDDFISIPGVIQAEYYYPPVSKIGLIYKNNTVSGKPVGREVDVKTTLTYFYPVNVSVTGIYPVTIHAASRSVASVDFINRATSEVIGSYAIATAETSFDTPILINTTIQLRKGNYALGIKVKNGDHRVDKIVIGDATSTNPNDPGISANIETKAKSTFRLYPNPSSNTIQIENNGLTDIKIMSIDGKTLFQKSFNDKTSIDISHFKKGIYFVKVNDLRIEKLIIK